MLGHIAILFLLQHVKTFDAQASRSCAPIQKGAHYTSGTVYSEAGKMSFCPGVIDKEGGASWGTFSPEDMYSTGWGKLQVFTNSRSPDNEQTRAAGYLEGVMTGPYILAYEDNMLSAKERFPRGLPEKIKNFYTHHLEWLDGHRKVQADLERDDVEGGDLERGADASYWNHVGFVHDQMKGIAEGANAVLADGKSLETWRILMLNAHIELLQLRDSSGVNWQGNGPAGTFQYQKSAAPFASLEKPQHTEYSGVSPWESQEDRKSREHPPSFEWLQSWQPSWMKLEREPLSHISDPEAHACTTAVALTTVRGKPDIAVGHNTWGPYSLMTRVWKYYNMPLQEPNTVATEWSVPGWPGVVAQSYDLFGLSRGKVKRQASDSADFEREPEEPEVSLGTTGVHFWVADHSILNKLDPKDHVMSTMRYLVATRLAKNAKDWVTVAAKHNGWGAMSGTMYAVDYGKVARARTMAEMPKEGVLMMLENTPGIAAVEDHTSHLLRDKAVGLFNKAISKEVTAQRGGEGLAFNERASAFVHEIAGLNSAQMMEEMMTKDPFAPRDGGSYGSIDAKVVSSQSASNMQCKASCGPPLRSSKGYQLSTVTNDFKAQLMPIDFDFGWYTMHVKPGTQVLEMEASSKDEVSMWMREFESDSLDVPK